MLNNKNLQKNLARTGVQSTRNLGPLFKISSWTNARVDPVVFGHGGPILHRQSTKYGY